MVRIHGNCPVDELFNTIVRYHQRSSTTLKQAIWQFALIIVFESYWCVQLDLYEKVYSYFLNEWRDVEDAFFGQMTLIFLA